MVANDTRAWFTAVEAFWKKSFQTSTGYICWRSTEHISSVTKLLAVRFVALGKKIGHQIKILRAYGGLSQDGNVARAKLFSGIQI